MTGTARRGIKGSAQPVSTQGRVTRPGLSDPDRSAHPHTVLGEWLEAGEGALHRHRRHQLIYADAGVITVVTGQGRWVCPPDRAVWVPGGVEHTVHAAQRFRLCTYYLQPGVLAAAEPDRCAVVGVPDLVREILRAALELRADAPAEHPIRQALALVPALVQPLEKLSRGLPLPADRRARHVATRWLTEPDDATSLSALASDAGASVRTLERLFRNETGLGLAQWRTCLRMAVAMERLGAGESVTTVAYAVGYSDVSAFGRAFRQAHGMSPASIGRLRARNGRS